MYKAHPQGLSTSKPLTFSNIHKIFTRHSSSAPEMSAFKKSTLGRS